MAQSAGKQQGDLFDSTEQFWGETPNRLLDLQKKGINAAVENADACIPNWSEIAMSELLDYARHCKRSFLVEEVRMHRDVPEPPSKRAWGGVVRRAASDGYLAHAGYANTTNAKAHGTPASLWVFIGK